MTKTAQDRLCKALEMAEATAEIYEQSMNECDEGPGREIFDYLHEQKTKQVTRLEDINDKLSGGENWSGACDLEQIKPADDEDLLKDAASGFSAPDSCQTELSALATGLEKQQSAIEFYEHWIDDVEDPVEQKFVDHMLQEERAFYLLLNDTQYFYEDPEGWSLKQDDQILDGA